MKKGRKEGMKNEKAKNREKENGAQGTYTSSYFGVSRKGRKMKEEGL